MKIKFLDLGDQIISLEKLLYIKKLDAAYSGMVFLEFYFEDGIRSEKGFQTKEERDIHYDSIVRAIEKAH